ncbi:hypothetical protein BJY59DRAFT_700683 [Rhodotorula toruloides]
MCERVEEERRRIHESERFAQGASLSGKSLSSESTVTSPLVRPHLRQLGVTQQSPPPGTAAMDHPPPRSSNLYPSQSGGLPHTAWIGSALDCTAIEHRVGEFSRNERSVVGDSGMWRKERTDDRSEGGQGEGGARGEDGCSRRRVQRDLNE